MSNRAIIVSPNSSCRKRLEYALQQGGKHDPILSLVGLEEARSVIRSLSDSSTVFLDSEFGEEEIADFLERVRTTLCGKKSRYVLILRAGHDDRPTIAGSMMVGMHSFLCEPFSVDSVLQSVGLAERISLKDSLLRLKAAAGLTLLDTFAKQDSDHMRGADSPWSGDMWKQVQNAWRRYTEITGDSLSLPVKKHLAGVRPSLRLKRYRGVSERVRKLVQNRCFGNIFSDKNS